MVEENRIRVQRYYQNHKQSVLAKKTIYFCRKFGRVPRFKTCAALDLSVHEILRAFEQWSALNMDDASMQSKKRRLTVLCGNFFLSNSKL